MFGKQVKLLSLIGFEVKIDASWLLLALLVTWSLAQGVFPHDLPGADAATYWLMGVVGALGLFASIILHELAHAVVARSFDIPIRGITLFIFGGVAEMERDPPSPRGELWMALAGPAASLMLAAGFQLLTMVAQALGGVAALAIVAGYLAVVNVALAVFNMIPAFPLDGGRVLRALLWRRWGNPLRATRVASQWGAGFGYALIGLGALFLVSGAFVMGLWWGLIGLFLANIARGQVAQMETQRVLARLPVSALMTSPAETVAPQISLREFADAHVYRSFHDIYPVSEGSHPLGLASIRRLGEVPRGQWASVPVESILSRLDEDNTIQANASAVEALTRMQRSGNSRLVVLDGRQLVGVIALKDLLKPIAVHMQLSKE
ncbi:MAG: site-2 protease family protein [Pseudomonadota bacterium]